MSWMSWQCTEGPYGKYPGECGYEEDLERFETEGMHDILHSNYIGDDEPWCWEVYWQLKGSNLNEMSFNVPVNEENACERLVNYLCKKERFRSIKVHHSSNINLTQNQINDSKKVIFEIYKDVDDAVLEEIIKAPKVNKTVIYFWHRGF